MDLSIIILSYNTQKILINCLKSIYAAKVSLEFEVIVVDNASRDDSVSVVSRSFPKVILVKNKENIGFGKGNNQGFNKSRGKYVLFLNSDTVVKGQALEILVSYLESHPNIQAVGPRLLNSDQTVQPSVGFFPSLWVIFNMLFLEHFGGGNMVRTSFSHEKEADWLMGAALLVRRKAFEKINGFDERIFMYYDEVEFCYRLKKEGYKVVYLPRAEIVHLWQKSSATGREGPILANYSGLIYFYQKHKSALDLIILKVLLKTKAVMAYGYGLLTNNQHLKETYEKAIKLV